MNMPRLLLAVVVAAVAMLPFGAQAAKRSGREKSRAHKTRSEKSSRHGSSGSKTKRRAGASTKSERGAFEQRWDQEQVEPELPQSE